MYLYDHYDRTLVQERVIQFRDQTRRYLAGELSEEQFKPLRLMNGLYVQRHAPMLRIAIPYGLLRSEQLRVLARITREYDKGYAHFTTRQNLQLNWPQLKDVPDILAQLAAVDMHAIQTSGNCIRNVTSDHLAGVSADEIEDPRPYCEIIRQWSTLHPEFSFLPRKFKIAVTGSQQDRAASQVHDIGLHLVRNTNNKNSQEIGFEVLVGGGLGRTPIIGKVIREFLPKRDLLSYLEAILRVYNQMGRRDNLYKARIKILVNHIGIVEFRRLVEAEWARIKDTSLALEQSEIDRISAFFAPPAYVQNTAKAIIEEQRSDKLFANWLQHNTRDHKIPGYRVVFVSLKVADKAPGDIDHEQMEALGELADRYSFGFIRVAHDQNLVLADVREQELYALWRALRKLKLANANIGKLTDMICCPGLDFCSLANAGAIPVAKQIYERFADLDQQYELGDIRVNISGCMNACAHHHVGHIGILGVDKNGEEWYQLTLGGSSAEHATIGQRLGPAVAKTDVADTIAKILRVYVERRESNESFLTTVQRIGIDPFKEQVYETHH